MHEFKKHHPTWTSTDNRPTSALTILCGGSWCHRCDAEVPSTPSRSVQGPSRTGPKHTPPLRHGREILVCLWACLCNQGGLHSGNLRRRRPMGHGAVVFHDPPATSKRWTGPVNLVAWRDAQPSSTWVLQDQRSTKPVPVVERWKWKPRMGEAAVSASQDYAASHCRKQFDCLVHVGAFMCSCAAVRPGRQCLLPSRLWPRVPVYSVKNNYRMQTIRRTLRPGDPGFCALHPGAMSRDGGATLHSMREGRTSIPYGVYDGRGRLATVLDRLRNTHFKPGPQRPVSFQPG